MKKTLTTKIARELSDYFKKPNNERTAAEQDKLLQKIKETDQVLKLLKDESDKQPELPLGTTQNKKESPGKVDK